MDDVRLHMQLLGHRGGRLLAAWPALGALARARPRALDVGVHRGRRAHRGALRAPRSPRAPAGDSMFRAVHRRRHPLALAALARAVRADGCPYGARAGQVAWSFGVGGHGNGAWPSDWACRGAGWARGTALTTMALSVPLAAHAVSGMEAALATTLATSAALLGARPRVAALLAGLAAAIRPEMAPWACALAVGLTIAAEHGGTRRGGGGVARWIEAAAIAIGPFTLCALVRTWAWEAGASRLAREAERHRARARLCGSCRRRHLGASAPAGADRSGAAAAGARDRTRWSRPARRDLVVGGDWMPYAACWCLSCRPSCTPRR